MAATPLIIIGKVAHDSPSASPPLRPLNDFNVTQYIFNTNLDLTSDENFWSCLAGTLPYSFVRLGFDQMAVQRFIAARTLRQAKRIPVIGAAFVITFFVVSAFGALAIIYWYRDCDLALTGAISSYDELFISMYTSAAGPFAGLVLLAISSPWVNAKGVTWACLLVCALQLWHGAGRGLAAIPPLPVIPGTTGRCPLMTNTTDTPDLVEKATAENLPYVFPLYRLSFYWMALSGELLTIILGTAFSLLTGGARNVKNNLHLTSVCILSIWRHFKFFRRILQNEEANSVDGKKELAGNRGDEESVPLTDFAPRNTAEEMARTDGGTDSKSVRQVV
ncbi:hypothetical protein MTO96_044968 [Rhipicephalus appendiculatus]